MAKKDYNDFKRLLAESAASIPKEEVVVEAQFEEVKEEPKAEPKAQSDEGVSGNGHKPNGHVQEETEEVEATDPSTAMTDAQSAEMTRQQEDSRRRMELKEVERAIPGNRYLFNRDPEHMLETAIINPLQLHAYVSARIQTAVLKEDWDGQQNMVADMYVQGMLEGSIAIDGEARKQFVSLTQFKNEENMRASRGGLFDATGPGG
jgi:hypothetical protein